MHNRLLAGWHLFAWLLFLSGAAPGLAQGPPLLSYELVATGVNWPLGVEFPNDGSGRMFIVEHNGRIKIHDGGEGLDVLPTPFLDVSDLVPCVGNSWCGEKGLLGMAFHPQYATNGFFYIYYTDTDRDGVLARYSVSADPDVADPDSAEVLLFLDLTNPDHHFAGKLAFGPEDGYLYLSLGDNASSEDAQDPSTLLGSVVRLDVDGGFPYAIPPDNPFAGDPSGRDEIWVYGLRNPWRATFDRMTGDLFIGDVGNTAWEEIDYLPAGDPGGANYGWPIMEGAHCRQAGCDTTGLTTPILEYPHGGGVCSIVGGYRYRGARYPRLQGYYVYADWCNGSIWGAVPDGEGGWSSDLLASEVSAVTSFGENPEGELYIAEHRIPGNIYHLEQTLIFRDGFESGDLSAWSQNTGR